MGPGLCQAMGQGCAYRGVPCRNASRGIWKDEREESGLRVKTLDIRHKNPLSPDSSLIKNLCKATEMPRVINY